MHKNISCPQDTVINIHPNTQLQPPIAETEFPSEVVQERYTKVKLTISKQEAINYLKEYPEWVKISGEKIEFSFYNPQGGVDQKGAEEKREVSLLTEYHFTLHIPKGFSKPSCDSSLLVPLMLRHFYDEIQTNSFSLYTPGVRVTVSADSNNVTSKKDRYNFYLLNDDTPSFSIGHFIEAFILNPDRNHNHPTHKLPIVNLLTVSAKPDGSFVFELAPELLATKEEFTTLLGQSNTNIGEVYEKAKRQWPNSVTVRNLEDLLNGVTSNITLINKLNSNPELCTRKAFRNLENMIRAVQELKTKALAKDISLLCLGLGVLGVIAGVFCTFSGNNKTPALELSWGGGSGLLVIAFLIRTTIMTSHPSLQ